MFYTELDAAASFRSFGNDSSEEATKVTRKIMIIKPPGYMIGSPPVSPSGSVTPTSPFTGNQCFRLVGIIGSFLAGRN